MIKTKVTTKTMINNRFFLILISLTVFLSVQGQEKLFKEFADSHKERAFCFYPSTLRMLNISGNPEFNEAVNGVEKLLVYKLDSISVADRLYDGMLDDFRKKGFEEYISITGGDYNVSLLVSPEQSDMQYVGVFSDASSSMAFYLNGDLKWEEIPKIFNSIKDGDFINILDLNTSQFEKHP